ncbi:MAG: metallophosphoesterase [Bryobacterales bacterium]|nr:metallophosphoesterase [Bryobacterales bacterium]
MVRAFLCVTMMVASGVPAAAQFLAQELLGRVADRSVTLNLAADRDLEVAVEYGDAPGSYTLKTEPKRFAAGVPAEILLDQLEPNRRYYYRVLYREVDAGEFLTRDEHTFHTQRPRGESFTFAVQFDPHMDENSLPEVYRLTLENELAAQPDFLIDLGDTMMSDKLPQPYRYEAVRDRHQLLRSFYDLVCHSMPLFLVLGNHEGEWGTMLRGSEEELPIWATKLRKAYFPNPEPNGFFGGSGKEERFVGLRQNHYSWEWGDALFVVLDPYWYTPVRPETAGDWSLTLGKPQYDWLKQTLENSNAPFKFVFAHNLVGGKDMDGKMRGGVEVAKYLEWGGHNLDDTWGFDVARPGWPMPIHQLLVANNVTAFFHGHDHIYARQELDGILYQEGPQPSARNANLGNRPAIYNYRNGTVLDGVGHVRVHVSPAEVRTEFVRTWLPAAETGVRKNGEIADAHRIPVRTSPPMP